MNKDLEIMKLLNDFMYSDFMDKLITRRLTWDYENILAFINRASQAVEDGEELDEIDMQDFDAWMNDIAGIQQVIEMYEYQPKLDAPTITPKLMEAWVKWREKNPA